MNSNSSKLKLVKRSRLNFIEKIHLIRRQIINIKTQKTWRLRLRQIEQFKNSIVKTQRDFLLFFVIDHEKSRFTFLRTSVKITNIILFINFNDFVTRVVEIIVSRENIENLANEISQNILFSLFFFQKNNFDFDNKIETRQQNNDHSSSSSFFRNRSKIHSFFINSPKNFFFSFRFFLFWTKNSNRLSNLTRNLWNSHRFFLSKKLIIL